MVKACRAMNALMFQHFQKLKKFLPKHFEFSSSINLFLTFLTFKASIELLRKTK